MSSSPLSLLFVALLGAAACTKPNPAVCCLDTADCNEVGIGEVRDCAAGLACVDHQCDVPSCASAGCAAAAPVCNTTTDVCDPCASSDDCSRFADAPVCDTSSGGCVQCLATPDCAGATPICDGNTCRALRDDADCASGALGDDGACIPEGDSIYIDPNGSDVGSCTRSVPCRTPLYAVSLVTASRNHIVFAPGQYITGEHNYTSSIAPALYFHGHGAEIVGTGGDGCTVRFGISTTVKDLKVTISSTTGSAMCVVSGPNILERIETSGAGVQISGATTVRDFKQVVGVRAFVLGDGPLILDGAVIKVSSTAIYSTSGVNTSIQLSNMLIYNTAPAGRALEFEPGTSGTISSSTIVTVGSGTGGIGARAVVCPSTVLIRSSIVWSPGTTQVPISGCNLTNVIAGPVAVAGAMNVDPQFVDLAQANYHLAAGSPARDVVSTGPARDFEGDARPQGVKFDIGADEAPP